MTDQERLDDINRQVQEFAKTLSSDDKLKFTGFKARWNYNDTTFWEEGFVGQWVDWRSHPKDNYFYVNVPGMQSGPIKNGQMFDIGTERIHFTTPMEEILKSVRAGFDLLMQSREKVA